MTDEQIKRAIKQATNEARIERGRDEEPCTDADVAEMFEDADCKAFFRALARVLVAS